jgi:hypothetical protein
VPRIRGTNRARYEASIRKQRSMRLKLMRRMLVTDMSSHNGVVTIAGRVVSSASSPPATARSRVRLKAPQDGEAAVYRMNTRVKLYDWFAKTYPTFTLPRYVDLG